MTDAQALETFEALVLSQQPAREPWRPVTDYSFEARKQIEGKHPELIRDVFQATRVLDAGCGRDAVLVWLLREVGVDAWGFDVSIPSRRWNDPERCAWLMPGDLADSGLLDDGDRAISSDHDFEIVCRSRDLVICREVLEHLTISQIRIAVRNLCRLSSRFVYLTTRFHLAPQHLLDVMTSDDLDPTHITMLNQDFLRVLFVLEGFKRRPDLERAMDWKNLGRCLVYERAA